MLDLKSINIRLATEQDLPALIRVGDALFDNPIKPERAKEFFSDARHHLVLAFYGDQVVGMASALDYVHPDKNTSLFINEVAVVDEFQNKGIGRRLVSFLCAHGRDMDAEEIWVATEHSNTAARKAYKAAGGSEDDEPVVLINFD